MTSRPPPFAEQGADLDELPLPSDERRGRYRQVRVVQRLQRRKLGRAELEQPHRLVEVLQPMLAKIAELAPVDQLARRLRQQHLPSVAGAHDPRRLVHVQADVLRRVEPRLPV